MAVKRLINEMDFRELRKEAGFDDLCVLFLKCFQVFAANLMSLRHQNVVELLGVTFRPPR